MLKLLGLPDPAPTVGIMLDRKILAPVLPEIEPGAGHALATLIAAEREVGVEPDPIRRLAALLPRDPEIAADVGARLRLSNKARKRLVSAATGDAPIKPRALAYRLGVEGATDRLLLAGDTMSAREIAGWKPPRLSLGGGALIARGVPKGPEVARLLRRIEDRWVAEDFPAGERLDAIVAETISAR
jgi:poly(A) polymerase